MIVTSHNLAQAVRLATATYVGRSDEKMLPLDKKRDSSASRQLPVVRKSFWCFRPSSTTNFGDVHLDSDFPTSPGSSLFVSLSIAGPFRDISRDIIRVPPSAFLLSITDNLG